jgi:hypothetical protein
MSKTRFIVEYRRASDSAWRESMTFDDKTDAEKHFEQERKRFLTFQHRIVRVSVVKESR